MVGVKSTRGELKECCMKFEEYCDNARVCCFVFKCRIWRCTAAQAGRAHEAATSTCTGSPTTS